MLRPPFSPSTITVLLFPPSCSLVVVGPSMGGTVPKPRRINRTCVVAIGDVSR